MKTKKKEELISQQISEGKVSQTKSLLVKCYLTSVSFFSCKRVFITLITFFAEEKKNGEAKGGKYLKNIFLWKRRQTEKEKEENVGRRKKYSFLQRKGKTEKEKEENVCRRKVLFFLEEKKKTEKEKGGKFGEGKYIFLWTRRKLEMEKGENIWGRKIFF